MPNWKHTVDCSEFWHDDSVPISEKGKKLATLLRIKVFKHCPDDWQLEEIIESFECITGCPGEFTETEEFNGWLEELYDWADRDHRLWIKTRA